MPDLLERRLVKTELDRRTRDRVQEEAGRQIKLEGLAFELNEWLTKRGAHLLFDDSLRLSDGKTYVELGDIRLDRVVGAEQ